MKLTLEELAVNARRGHEPYLVNSAGRPMKLATMIMSWLRTAGKDIKLNKPQRVGGVFQRATIDLTTVDPLFVVWKDHPKRKEKLKKLEKQKAIQEVVSIAPEGEIEIKETIEETLALESADIMELKRLKAITDIRINRMKEQQVRARLVTEYIQSFMSSLVDEFASVDTWILRSIERDKMKEWEEVKRAWCDRAEGRCKAYIEAIEKKV